MGVLKESSWNYQQVGVLRVDASSPTDMLRDLLLMLRDLLKRLSILGTCQSDAFS